MKHDVSEAAFASVCIQWKHLIWWTPSIVLFFSHFA